MGIIIETIFSLLLFSGGVVLLLFLNKKIKSKVALNYILSGIALLFYLLLIVFDGQYHHWDNATILDINPLSKMSPFLFATAFFANFLPKKSKPITTPYWQLCSSPWRP